MPTIARPVHRGDDAPEPEVRVIIRRHFIIRARRAQKHRRLPGPCRRRRERALWKEAFETKKAYAWYWRQSKKFWKKHDDLVQLLQKAQRRPLDSYEH